MRAAIYARKSSDSDDKQVLSLPAQVGWARERCRDLGLSAPLVLEESRSAKTPGRPAFNRLMALVEAGKIDTILCWKADRLARNALDGGRVVWALETRTLERIETSDRTYGGKSDEVFILGLELGLSAKYSKDLAQNIRRGMAEKLKRGEWPGYAPLGYKNVREGADHSMIAVDERTAPLVSELFRVAASGTISLSELAKRATDEWGLRLPRRRPNTPERGIAVTTLHFVLRNPFYYGAMRMTGQLYAGTHTPLVTKETFDRVQEVLSGRRTMAERPKRLRFALTGLLRCGKCGRNLTAYAQKKPSGKAYTYYTCTSRMRGRCDLPPLSEPRALAPVRDTLSKLALTRPDLDLALGRLAELRERAGADIASRRGSLDARIAASKKTQADLLDLILAGTVTRADYERKRAELTTEETRLTLERDS
ncbi:MAG: recombinase family protein, partial [Thermoanaerobaculia bacterium]